MKLAGVSRRLAKLLLWGVAKASSLVYTSQPESFDKLKPTRGVTDHVPTSCWAQTPLLTNSKDNIRKTIRSKLIKHFVYIQYIFIG